MGIVSGGGGVQNPVKVPLVVAPSTDTGNALLKVQAPAGSFDAGGRLLQLTAEDAVVVVGVSPYGQVDIVAPSGQGSARVTTREVGHAFRGADLRTSGAAGVQVSRDSTQAEALFAGAVDGVSVFEVLGTGGIFATLPTADPHVAGQLWNNAGAVKSSAGP